MARQARSDAPGEIHHVWVRGLERRTIFVDHQDRADLLERFSAVLPESGVRCLAWALLPNHFHLVLKRADVPLSRVMSRINTGYATRFNKRHERAGFLFQNRFGSRIVDGDAELISVVKYVVNNPIKHHVCADERALVEYPWGSWSGLRGRRPPYPFESPSQTEEILSGRSTCEPSPKTTVQLERRTPPEEELEGWVGLVCDLLGVEEEAIAGRGRSNGVADARAALCWLGVTSLGLPGARIAERLQMSRSGVSRALPRGRLICNELGLSGDGG